MLSSFSDFFDMQPEQFDWDEVLSKSRHSELSVLRIAVFMLCCLTALSLLSLAFALGLQRLVRRVLSQKDLEAASPVAIDRPGFFKSTYFVEPPILSAVIRNA